MLDAAIRMSLQSARLNNNGAGPSSSRLVSSDPRAALHAAAVERRLAALQNNAEDHTDSTYNSELDPLTSDEDEALSKSKGKAKAKTVSTPSKSMSLSEMRRINREHRQQLVAARMQNKKEEYALARKLGRKLTMVTSILKSLLRDSLSTHSYSRPRRPQSHCKSFIPNSGTFGAI
jgi:DNA repair protein RAD16